MYENRIVTEPSSLIRKIARDTLKGHWKDIVIGVFIYLVLTSFVSTVFDTIFPNYQTFEVGGYYYSYNVSFIGSLYSLIFLGAFAYGFALFMLTFFRTKNINRTLLFEGFSILWKAIVLDLLMALFIFLWALLLFIPGIIAALRYSQAFFILADHPEYTPMQCINESKIRMNGNKTKLFCLYFSFIGWYILAGLAESGMALAGNGLVASLISALFQLIPHAFLIAYVYMAMVVFYELLVGNLAVVNRDSAYNQEEPIHMVNADYQVHEEEPDEPPYVAPDERESYHYAPKNEDDFGSPRKDDFGAPAKEEDDF